MPRTTKSTYREKLKDPRWQRKRLEILERDNWTCCVCGATEDTLNVHHGYYCRGRNPWDYPDDTLWTLCEICHGEHQAWLTEVHAAIGRVHPQHYHRFVSAIDDLRLASGYFQNEKTRQTLDRCCEKIAGCVPKNVAYSAALYQALSVNSPFVDTNA